MNPRLFAAAALCALAAGAGRADVTLRYSFDIKPGPMLPPQAVEAMKGQLPAPMSVVTQLKGSKAYSKMMGFITLTDFDGARITFLDPANKRFATVDSTEYVAAVAKQAEIPPEGRKIIDAMKFDVQTRATGRTSVIQGIQSEERELVLTMEMPVGPPGGMRAVLSFWAAKSEEISRHPGLRELAQYSARAYAGMNPADMMQKMFAQLPGMGEKLRTMMEEFKSTPVILGMRGAVHVPGLAAVAPAGADPNAPMMEFVMDLQELSTAGIPDSVFQVPEGYQQAPIEEILKSVMPAPGGGNRRH